MLTNKLLKRVNKQLAALLLVFGIFFFHENICAAPPAFPEPTRFEPKPKEVRTFLDDKTPDKRVCLVRRLLEDRAHVEHFVHVSDAKNAQIKMRKEEQGLEQRFLAFLLYTIRYSSSLSHSLSLALAALASGWFVRLWIQSEKRDAEVCLTEDYKGCIGEIG